MWGDEVQTIQGNEVAIVENRLYFATVQNEEEIESTYTEYHAWCYDNIWSGPADYFGPLTLNELSIFTKTLNNLLSECSDKPILFVTKTHRGLQEPTNAAFLIGCYMVQTLGITPREAVLILDQAGTFLPFKNSNTERSCFISILDCLKGYEKALHNFFDMNLFCANDYMDCDIDMNLSWIIPNKMIAFRSPMDVPDSFRNSPEFYASYFKENNVKIVVRLNSAEYDANLLGKFGISHFHLEFEDMQPPPKELVYEFLEICKIADNCGVAIAVHCMAGLGRTGTMIACYMMKTYKMTARESISWLRMVRPFSVFGIQQEFLESMEKEMWSLCSF